MPIMLLSFLRLGIAVFFVVACARRVAAWLRPRPSAFDVAVVAHAVALLPLPALGLLGLLGPTAIMSAYALLYAAARWRLRHVPVQPRPGEQGKPWLPALVLLMLLAAILALYSAPAPRERDDLAYHLHFAARWAQDGRISIVPTPFGDNAPAYFACNTELLYAAATSLWGSDLVTALATTGYLGLLALATYELTSLMGGTKQWAALAASLPLLTPIVWSAANSRGVDVPLAALLAACAVLCVRALGRPSWRTALMFSAGVGMCIGAKPLGLPYVLPLGLAALAAWVWQKRWGALGILLLGAIAFGGWWYVRNLCVTANPVYPLDVRVFGIHLRGAYDVTAMKHGEFHITDRRFLFRRAVACFGGGVVPTVLSVLWVLGMARGGWRKLSHWLVLACGCWIVYCHFFLTPHNGPLRFLIPALPVACAGLGLCMEPSRSPAGELGSHSRARLCSMLHAAAGLLVVAVGGYRLLRGLLMPWFADTFHGAASAWTAVGLAASVWAVIAWALYARSVRPCLYCAGLGVLGLAVCTLAQRHVDATRDVTWARVFGVDMARAWQHIAADTGVRVVAYAGQNLPYPLVGPRLRRRAVYVNVWGGPHDHFHDFHRRLRPELKGRLAAYHKPAYYRRYPDFAQWIANLKTLRVDALAVYRLTKAEAKYLRRDADGFPLERDWALSHPEMFAPLYRSPQIELYRVRH